jgi:hypothetical protein
VNQSYIVRFPATEHRSESLVGIFSRFQAGIVVEADPMNRNLPEVTVKGSGIRGDKLRKN